MYRMLAVALAAALVGCHPPPPPPPRTPVPPVEGAPTRTYNPPKPLPQKADPGRPSSPNTAPEKY